MAQLNISLDQDEVLRLLGDDSGNAFRVLLQETLNAVLRAESAEQLRAQPYERTAERTDSRNGTRKRPLTTRVGTIELTVPRHRNVPFKTLVLGSESLSEMLALIDAYLEGSPTAGTGKYYAAAAWDNGVDPRWAPAISLVESGKGEACFASYNAWGYGGVGFSSWQEGIEEVVSSLGSSLYGGYLTKEAAKTYCPPTWQQWYNECAEQMAMI